MRAPALCRVPMSLNDAPPEVRALYKNLAAALDQKDAKGRKVGDAKYGVYCFYDFDGEPIYVGQTREKLRTRIRRHLTNQRTDAVAMFVLDPYEVHTIKMWPFWELEGAKLKEAEIKEWMDRAEWTVYAQAVKDSKFSAVLNEGFIAEKKPVKLPSPHAASITPKAWEDRNKHPDVRITRRAQTIWALSKVAAERDVSMGLRRTLVVQAKRLLHLANERYEALGGEAATPTPESGESGEVEGDGES